jgi:hypothetical protein
MESRSGPRFRTQRCSGRVRPRLVARTARRCRRGIPLASRTGRNAPVGMALVAILGTKERLLAYILFVKRAVVNESGGLCVGVSICGCAELMLAERHILVGGTEPHTGIFASMCLRLAGCRHCSLTDHAACVPAKDSLERTERRKGKERKQD